MSTSSRTLQLLSLLQSHRYWPGGDLADRLGVSLRTVRRDVDRLRELGYPVEAQRGVSGGYQLAVGASLPPLVLDDEEAVALTLGLMSAAVSPVAGMAESSVRALAKVVQVMPAALRRRVEALRAMTEPAPFSLNPATTIDPGAMTVLAQACRDLERVAFGYEAADGVETQRLVEPLRLVPMGRRWYLVAYDLTRHDWRCFRLDRLANPLPTGARFAPRDLPAQDAAEFVRQRVRPGPGTFDVEARVHEAASIVQNRIGRWGVATDERSGGWCVLRMTADSLDWAALALGSIGAEFEVIAPSELTTLISDWAGRFARAVA